MGQTFASGNNYEGTNGNAPLSGGSSFNSPMPPHNESIYSANVI